MVVTSFKGINNVLADFKVGLDSFTEADNVVIGNANEVLGIRSPQRLIGTSVLRLEKVSDRVYVIDNMGDVRVWDGTTLSSPVASSLDPTKAAFCGLPDGRAVITDGTQIIVTDGVSATDLGVLPPTALGSVVEISGGLTPGKYRYALTRVRLSDGVESAPLMSEEITLSSGGLIVAVVDIDPSHKHRLYLTSEQGEEFYYAAESSGATVAFSGVAAELTKPCRTEFLSPTPPGQCIAFWRGRLLVAQQNVLWASQTFRPNHVDRRRDFKQFAASITALAPVVNGVYVGTSDGVYYLDGQTWDTMKLKTVCDKGAVLGSAVVVDAKNLSREEGKASSGVAAVLIAGTDILHCYDGGLTVTTTQSRYRVPAAEKVVAGFTTLDGVPVYWVSGLPNMSILQNTLNGAITHSSALAGYGVTKDFLAKNDGIYGLGTGPLSTGYVKSGKSLFGTTNKKLFDAVFLFGQLNGSYTLSLGSESGWQQYRGTVKNGVARFTPGRGFRSSYVQYTLTTAGADGSVIDAIEIVAGRSNVRKRS